MIPTEPDIVRAQRQPRAAKDGRTYFGTWAVAEWWSIHHPDLFRFPTLGLGEPFCFRCGWLPPVSGYETPQRGWELARGWLEEAHLADFCALRDSRRLDEDTIANRVLLCHQCHREDMPEFGADQHDDALAWVTSYDGYADIKTLITTAIYEQGKLPKGAGKGVRLQRMVYRRMARSYLELFEVLSREPAAAEIVAKALGRAS